ncbi:MAG: hypothetical protein FJY75_05855 [Candidatus Eisenbacteria bacterium]|uniref:DUF2341 domain-containing protein n=1 Tax=Eiseniibacteriota bacterium TaxID=2212470 RepID=A0A938BNM0_UNCEI|nr:hypothetical protein [Candidatus Eisenbacteria bacterium]
MTDWRGQSRPWFIPATIALGAALLLSTAGALEPSSPQASGSPALLAGDRPEGLDRAAWVDIGWAYRYPITVRPDSIEGTGDLDGFALLLPLGDDALAGVFDRAKPDGSDLLLTAGDGMTPLPREIVSYDPAARKAEIWVRAGTLSREQNVFFLYCGNPEASFEPSDGSVWDAADLGVFHFAESPAGGLLRDYGPGANHALPKNGWTSADTTAGPIGQAWLLNGTTHWIDGDAIQSADSSYTISAWFAVHDPLSAGADFAFQSEAGYWHLSAKRNETHRNADYSRSGAFISWNPYPLPDTLLHHFVWVLDGQADTLRFYFDGVEQGIKARWAPLPPHKVYTGNRIGGNVGIASPIWGNSQDLFKGIVDEFRVREGLRAPQWIRTEYRNQRAGAAFYDFGEEQTAWAPGPDAVARRISLLRAHPNPLRDRATIELLLGGHEAGRLEIFDPAGRRVRDIAFPRSAGGGVLAVWDGSGDGGVPLGNGVYWLRARSGDAVHEARVVILR